MAKVVWKETLDPIDRQIVKIPMAATILYVAVQYGKPCIWFLCDSDNVKVDRTFRIVGTGHEISNDRALAYLGSFMMAGGALVFHIFEDLP